MQRLTGIYAPFERSSSKKSPTWMDVNFQAVNSVYWRLKFDKKPNSTNIEVEYLFFVELSVLLHSSCLLYNFCVSEVSGLQCWGTERALMLHLDQLASATLDTFQAPLPEAYNLRHQSSRA